VIVLTYSISNQDLQASSGIEQKYCNTENKIVRKKTQEQRMYTKEI
jgi:hypothetical protein